MLTAYLLGDLSERDEEKISAHLSGCENCRALAQETKQTLDFLQSSLAAASPDTPRLSQERRTSILNTAPPPESRASLPHRQAGGRSRTAQWFTDHHPRLIAYAACLVLMLFVAGMLLPSIQPAREKARRASGMAELSQVGKGMAMYKMDHADSAPESLEDLDKYLGGEILSDSKESGRQYHYFKQAADGDMSSDQPVAVQEMEEGGNVLYGDGSVMWQDKEELEKTMLKAKASRPRQELSPSSARHQAAKKEQKDIEVQIVEPEPPPELEEIREIAEERPPPDQQRVSSMMERGSEEAGAKRRPAESPEPAAFDSVAAVKSPVVMKGLRGSRLTEDREAKQAERKEEELVEVTFGTRSESGTGGKEAGKPVQQDDKTYLRGAATGPAVNGDISGRESRERTLGGFSRDTPGEEEADYTAPESGRSPADKGLKSRVAAERTADEARRPAGDAGERKAESRASGVNPFIPTAQQPFSTFAIDVDTASYTIARNYMLNGLLPPAESVRTEEFVNFFDYGYKPPSKGTFKVYTQCAPSKFGPGLHLLKIGVKGKRLGREEQQTAILTFAIDTSGSMNRPDRLGMIKKSLRMLIDQLAPGDRIAVVRFGSTSELVLSHTPASDKKEILAAIDSLKTSGSTNIERGMELAYETAAKGFKGGASNRVLIMSDGVANLGSAAAEAILEKVGKYRNQGIRCSVFGFGMGTYNDRMLETLANKGDGSYVFIDSLEEAKRVFVNDLAATLNVIASDVKIQVEFSPELVKRYRQLGYENRQLEKEQFRDDTVDAGEVGSGQSVTALYELDLDSRALPATARLQVSAQYRNPIAVVRVRYRRTDNAAVEEIEAPVYAADVQGSFRNMPPEFKLAAAVAELSEIMRGSPFASHTYHEVAAVLRKTARALPLDDRIRELARLAGTADSMSRATAEEETGEEP
jgi:Ca-activated chloride channel family protein